MLTMLIAITGIFLLAMAIVARDMRPATVRIENTSCTKHAAWTTTIALLVLAWMPVVLVVGAVAHACR